jgi:DNA (cytosine-5)-methyltransferase 1
MSNKIIPLGSYNPRGFCNGRIIEKYGISPALCLLKGAEHAITINDNGLTLDEKKEKVCEYVKLRNEGKLMDYDKKNLRIRKLTPKECWRLMGFDDEDFDKASQVNSNTQLYKQAGNSIVVNVLMAIFNELLKKEGE